VEKAKNRKTDQAKEAMLKGAKGKTKKTLLTQVRAEAQHEVPGRVTAKGFPLTSTFARRFDFLPLKKFFLGSVRLQEIKKQLELLSFLIYSSFFKVLPIPRKLAKR